MIGPDHYRLVGKLLTDRGVLDDVLIGTASVHATLALAAADIWSAISAGEPRQTRGAKAADSTVDS
jgi:hypothetical protein